LKFVRYLPTTDPERIGLVGLSMGGAVASILAGTNPTTIKALVLWSAAGIDTIKDIYHSKEDTKAYPHNEQGLIDLGGLWLNTNFYADLQNWNTYKTLQSYHGAALILQGTKDQTVPPATAEQYQTALQGQAKLVYIPEADHTYNRHTWEEQVLTETTGFLKNVLF
jgi:pimeloyl-ACP methyl ester carboxylesterase